MSHTKPVDVEILKWIDTYGTDVKKTICMRGGEEEEEEKGEDDDKPEASDSTDHDIMNTDASFRSKQLDRRREGRRKTRRKKRTNKKKIAYAADPELKKFKLVTKINKQVKGSTNISDRWKALDKILGGKLPESPIHRAEVHYTLKDMLDVVLSFEMDRFVTYKNKFSDEKWSEQVCIATKYYASRIMTVLKEYYWDYRHMMRMTMLNNGFSAKNATEREANLPNEEEIMPLWINIIRLHAFVHLDRYFCNKTSGSGLPELLRLMQKGTTGGCLVDLFVPIVDYPLTTLFKAIESLYTAWRELQFTQDLEMYFNLLFLRYCILSITVFTDTVVLDRPDMIQEEELPEEFHTQQINLRKKVEKNKHGTQVYDKNKTNDEEDIDYALLEATAQYRVNEKFMQEGEAILGSMKRELMTHRMLISLTEGCYMYQSSEEVDQSLFLPLMNSYKAWAVAYTDGPRATSIIQHFRDNLIGQMIRPGERERFRIKFPIREANATNVVSRLRPKDIERYRERLLNASVNKIIMGEEDFSGMHTGRNELAYAILRYYTEEQLESTRLEGLFLRKESLVDPNDVVEFGWDPTPAVIIQSLGCYIVWFPWNDSAVSVHHFPVAFYISCAQFLKDYHDTIHTKWVSGEDGKMGLNDVQDVKNTLEQWKQDRITALRDIFSEHWE